MRMLFLFLGSWYLTTIGFEPRGVDVFYWIVMLFYTAWYDMVKP